MKTSKRTQPSAASTQSSWFLACVLSFIAVSPAVAADAVKEPTTQTTNTNLTVAESTSIDKLIQKIYANSPLNAAILRKALVDVNPKVITGNPQQRVKAGTSIVVPDHGEVVRMTLMPYTAAAQEALDNNPAARDYQARKPWVRFP